jgi:HEAT repeat protein
VINLIEDDDVESLLESLKDEDLHVRVFTINSIVDNPGSKQTIPTLIRLLKEDVALVRSRIAWAMGKIKDKRTIKPLIQALKDDDSDVRKNATRALGEMMAFDAISALVIKLKDSSWEVRAEAIVVLEDLGWVPTSHEEQSLVYIAKEKWNQLLEQQDLDTELLQNFLNDPDKDVRSKVAWVLGEIKSLTSIKPLFELLMDDKFQEVKEQASSAIGKIGGEDGITLLKKALESENWFIRKCATAALGYTQDAMVLELLEDLVKDDNRFVSESAKIAIKQIKEKHNIKT